MIKGVDVSSHQKSIDWSKVKEAGYEFAIVRAGYRKSTDDYVIKNIEGAIKNGINVGLYWFSYAINEADAKEEAKLCVAIAKKYKIDLPIFYDFEYDTVDKAKLNHGVILNKTHFNKFTKAFCEEVEKSGYKAGLYYNLDYKRNWVDDSICSKYVQWLAYYSDEKDTEYDVQQYSNKGKVSGINGDCDVNWLFNESIISGSKEVEKMKYSREAIVKLAQSWVGKKESDGSHHFIIDIYNTYLPHPREHKLTYEDDWCAGTFSALGIKLGYTKIIPVECSCTKIIELSKEMGIWVEADDYVPNPGDGVIYDWQDGEDYAKTDNKNSPDHIGIVESINKDTNIFMVIEGNKGNAVARRQMKVNGRYIRGFVCPKYDTEVEVEVTKPTVTVDKTDTTPTYKVGKVYTLQVELNVRKGAGTNYGKKTHNQLTADGKKHDKDNDGALDKGTKVTCQQIYRNGKDVWIKCPSGWLAAYYQGNVYIK